MKVSAISGDMAVKLGLIGGGMILAYIAWQKVTGVAGDAIDTITENAGAAAGAILTGINPANPDNLVNKGVTAIGAAVVTDPNGAGKNADGSWTVGGWLFDVTHPGWQTAINAPVPPKVTPKAAPTLQTDSMGNYLGDW